MNTQLPSTYIADSRLGFGVFALRPIKAGETVMTLTGTPITYEQSVAMGKEESFSLQTGKKEYIHLDVPGRFINHSCEPNCGLRPNLELIALKDIKKDEQIFYDYSTTMLERHWVMRCDCRSSKCRYVVQDFDLLPNDIQNHYLKQGVVQQFILDLLQIPKPRKAPTNSSYTRESNAPSSL
jgi:uncharacterized protein